MANTSMQRKLRWGFPFASMAIVAVMIVANLPEGGVAAPLQLAQNAPAGAPQPAQPNGAPTSPQGEAEDEQRRVPGCRYEQKDDLQLLV